MIAKLSNWTIMLAWEYDIGIVKCPAVSSNINSGSREGPQLGRRWRQRDGQLVKQIQRKRRLECDFHRSQTPRTTGSSNATSSLRSYVGSD